MAKATKETKETKSEVVVEVAKAKTSASGLLFELENVAVGGRSLAYDVLKSLFSEKEVEISRVLFMRHCLSPCPKEYMPRLLDAVDRKRLSPDKLVGEVKDATAACYKDGGVAMVSGLKNLLKKAGERGLRCGALTSLPEDVAMALMTKLGMDTLGVQLLAIEPTGKDFPTADAWLKLAKKIGLPRSLCTSLATSAQSCRAALSAGMRCVALPDEFTSFQDFAGADLVFERFEGDAVERTFTIALGQ